MIPATCSRGYDIALGRPPVAPYNVLNDWNDLNRFQYFSGGFL